MARSKSHSDKRTPRDPSPIARQSLRVSAPSPIPRVYSPISPIVFREVLKPPAVHPVEDRRVFHPEGVNRPALKKSGLPARVVVKDRPRTKKTPQVVKNRFGAKVFSQTKAVLTFDAPKETLVCVRRHRRKEVLFAKRRAGHGGMRKPRRTWLSEISCR